MFKKLALLGIIFFACSSCVSGTATKTNVRELYNAPNGNYKVKVRCLSSNASEAVISDKSGSEVVRYPDGRCFGQYGEALIAVQGNEKRLFRFNEINEVLGGPYKLISTRRTVGATLATIEVDGQEIQVELHKNGKSNRVVKTTNGYIRN